MAKRLINFRGTEDFAYVKNRPSKPKGGGVTIGGPLWASCNPSPFEQSIQTAMYIQFVNSSHNRTGMLAGVYAGGIAGAAFGLPGAAMGMLTLGTLGSIGSTRSGFMAVAPVKPFKPYVFSDTKPPCPMKDPLSFEEPTFEEFKNLYPQYYGAK